MNPQEMESHNIAFIDKIPYFIFSYLQKLSQLIVDLSIACTSSSTTFKS